MKTITLISLTALLLAACGDDAQWITIDLENPEGLTLDSLEVEVVASVAPTLPFEGAAGCHAGQHLFPNDAGPLELPLEVVIASENDQWHLVAIRAVGSDHEGEQASAEGLFSFPIPGQGELRLGRCGDELCPRGQVCDDDLMTCVASTAAPLWEATGCDQ